MEQGIPAGQTLWHQQICDQSTCVTWQFCYNSVSKNLPIQCVHTIQLYHAGEGELYLNPLRYPDVWPIKTLYSFQPLLDWLTNGYWYLSCLLASTWVTGKWGYLVSCPTECLQLNLTQPLWIREVRGGCLNRHPRLRRPGNSGLTALLRGRTTNVYLVSSGIDCRCKQITGVQSSWWETLSM